MFSLSILIPVYNEINYLKEFTTRLIDSFKNENVEYIFINDGSTDGSSEWLKVYCQNNPDKNKKLINFEKNQGKGKAIKEGLLLSSGQYVLFQDADLELDTKDSLELFGIIKNNKNIDCIFGSRYLSGKIKKNKNLLNEFIGKLNSIIFNLLFQQSLSDVHCGTKIISKKVKNMINLTINDFGLEIDLASQIAKNNIEIYEYGISYFARTVQQGKKITWYDGLKSYYYLFKTRFIDNDLPTKISIIYTSLYMTYIGSHFGMGLGNDLMIIITFIIGLFIGLNRKIISSSIILFFCYFGSLFGQGNTKIYTVLLGFILGLFLSKKINRFFKKRTSNKKIFFFI